MKKIMPVLILIMVLPLVFAADLEVEKGAREPVVIVEIDRPASFDFVIKNNDLSDTFRIYTLVVAYIEPDGFFAIDAGESKEIKVLVSPHKETKESIRGELIFDYEIKGEDTGYFYDRLKIKIVPLKEAFEIEAENINPGDENAIIHLRNLEKFDFYDMEVKLKSPFFEFSETLNLSQQKNATFSIPINYGKVKNLKAGNYQIESDIKTEGAEAELGSEIKYLEKEGTSVLTESEGVIVKKKTITKTNEGNTRITAGIEDRKDVLSRLFTTYSLKPVSSERRGLYTYYSWEEEIEPGESFVLISKTNYTLPFVLLIFIILTAFIFKLALNKSIALSKRVSFVKTKGGEFALKVKLHAKARKDLEDIKIADRLPGMVKIYEKYGVKPDDIDEKTRRISWNLKKLNAGEERVFSYIIYSKINVVGRFELPAASATFKKDGKHQSVSSNKTYFMAESSARAD